MGHLGAPRMALAPFGKDVNCPLLQAKWACPTYCLDGKNNLLKINLLLLIDKVVYQNMRTLFASQG